MDSTVEQLVSRLRQDPNDADAYEALKAHYRYGGDLGSLANLLEGWAGYQSAPALASEAYLEAARSWRMAGGDDARAKALYLQAVQQDPLNNDATEELVALFEAAGETHELAEFLDGHLRALEAHDGDRAFMAALYTRLGELWKTVFERPDVARPCYERAIELDPSYTQAAYAARKLAQESGDVAEAARLYAVEAEAEDDPERRIQLYAKQADVAVGIGDLDSAIKALRNALALAPGDVEIMHRLAGYVAERGAQKTGPEAERDQRRVAELYYQIAQSVGSEDALAYLEAALTAMPSHDGALDLLERHAAQLGQLELLPKYWVGYLAQAAEGPEVDQRRIYLAEAYERAGQLEDAIFCLEQAHSDGQVADVLHRLKGQRHAPSVPPPAAPDDDDGAGGEAEVSPSDERAAEDLARASRPTARPAARGRLSAQGRAAVPSDRPLDISPRLTQLRRSVHELVAARKSDEAMSYCREILELDPTDPEAFSLLESQYRKARDHVQLRLLLLASTRNGGLSVDARKLRLREVAAISEAKLKDIDGAIDAWQSVVALDPADSDAGKSLKRLLQKTQRWDDLAAVLEREALTTTSQQEKIELIGQIAVIHRDKRKDLVEAAEALRQLLALQPDDALRDELCDMLLGNESYADAVPLLQERVASTSDEHEKLRLLRLLAATLEEKLGDDAGAYEASLAILALRNKDSDALDRMQRVDEKSGNVQRLLSTLERRAMLAVRGERPEIFVRMAEIAERNLGDLDKAAEYYGNALDLEPSHEGALAALYEMFERTGRYEDLVELLRERILVEKQPAQRAPLYRRAARMLHEHLHRDDDAADAYRSLLAAEPDEEALRFLIARARTASSIRDLAELVPRLLPMVHEPAERSALLFEHAQRLAEELARPREALEALREIVDKLDPDFEPAVALFATLCEQLGDHAGTASALRRKLDKSDDPAERIALAQRLANVYENDLADSDSATSVLLLWAAEDERNVEPHRRLEKLLTAAGRHAQLIGTLDALASWDDDFAARDRAVLEAARVAFEHLHDVNGAWKRLAPLAAEGHDDAFALLVDIARKSGRVADAAALCVKAAQEASESEVQGRQWGAAAALYANDLADATQALEAGLRMLATDLANRDHLTLVEGYAASAQAWSRLNQVYDRLLKLAADDSERVALLVRHAQVLDERAEDASEALDRILRACALAPNDEGLLARAEDLAKRADRSEELLVVYDRKRAKSDDHASKVEILLRAARLCDGALGDRERANGYLKTALAAAKANAELTAQVVSAAEELDQLHPEHGSDEALRSLVRAHREIAEKSEPEAGALLILQAHDLLKNRLGDERAAFDLLRQGTTVFPSRDDIYDAFVERATALKRLDAVDAHLSRSIDEAIEPKTAAVLLSRRARLLEGPLGRAEDAADVFAKLLQLRPDDAETATKLRSSLRKAKRFQDLLLSLHKQMQRVKSADEKLALLKEGAITWEQDLKNRWEALDAWRKVLDFAPQDEDAQYAVERLERRSVAPARPVEELFADEEEPVSSPDAADNAQESEPGVSEPSADAGEAVQALRNPEPTQEPAAESEPSSNDIESRGNSDSPDANDRVTASHAVNVSAASDTSDASGEPQPPEAQASSAEAAIDGWSTDQRETPVPDGRPESFDADALPAAPAAVAIEIDISVVDDEADEADQADQASETERPSAPARLTTPPTLPPRRSRSEPPPPSASILTAPEPPPSAAVREPSVPPPLPSRSSPPAINSAPPPLPPSARTGGLPPVRARSSSPPPLPAAARSSLPAGRVQSLPPPLPPSARTGGVPAVSIEPEQAPAGGTPSRPPPLPRRKKADS